MVMKWIAAIAAAAALGATMGMTTPSVAAESQTTVKVALLDMSASMGMGMMGGMMGPGMMGPGMMNPGMMGPGMMGPGMMGMMGGMMSIRTDQSSVRTGSVRFDVTNWSRGMLHEMLVVAVDSPAAPLPYDYGQAKVVEAQVKVLGDTSELQPNASRVLDLTLAPGSYLLICNVAGHYAAGMAVPFIVTP
jgi:uncharacterized cupredoxin-like copper-binding protein